jgi:hypothetical protein
MMRQAEPHELPSACGSCHLHTGRTAAPAIRSDPLSVRIVAKAARAEIATAALGPVSAEVAEARAAACRECPWLRQIPERPDPIGWCGACGCGDREAARLSRKTTMRTTCPKSRWPS